jgi:transketolase C-terminal domain/subunit
VRELAAEEDWYAARRGFNQLKEQIGEEAANVKICSGENASRGEPTTHAFLLN